MPTKPKPSGNPLTRKLGPLPAYAWLGVIVLAWFAYSHYKGSASSAVSATSPVPFSGSTADTSGGGGGGTNIPQLPIPTSTVALDPSGGSVPTPASISPGQAAAVDQGGAPGALAQGDASSPTPTYQSTPEAIAAAGDLPYTGPLANGQSGYVIDPSTGQVYTPSTSVEGGIRQRVGQPITPDALDRYLANTTGYDPYNQTFPATQVSTNSYTPPAYVPPPPEAPTLYYPTLPGGGFGAGTTTIPAPKPGQMYAS